MNKIVINGKEIMLSDGVLAEIHAAMEDYPRTEYEVENYEEEYTLSCDIYNALQEYFDDKRKKNYS